MKNKKNNIIAVRIDDDLNKLIIEFAIKETNDRKKIIKVSDVIREILERELK